MIRAHANSPTQLSSVCIGFDRQIGSLPLHTVSSEGPTNPSELCAGLCTFKKHWEALGELLILLSLKKKRKREWKHSVHRQRKREYTTSKNSALSCAWHMSAPTSCALLHSHLRILTPVCCSSTIIVCTLQMRLREVKSLI